MITLIHSWMNNNQLLIAYREKLISYVSDVARDVDILYAPDIVDREHPGTVSDDGRFFIMMINVVKLNPRSNTHGISVDCQTVEKRCQSLYQESCFKNKNDT